MMNTENLRKYLIEIKDLIDKSDKFLDNAYELCKIDFVETPIFEAYSASIDMCFNMICDAFSTNNEEHEKIYNDLSWFFFDYYNACKVDNNEMTIETAKRFFENQDILFYDIDSLVDYIESFKKNKDISIGDIVSHNLYWSSAKVEDIDAENNLILVKPTKLYKNDDESKPSWVSSKNLFLA